MKKILAGLTIFFTMHSAYSNVKLPRIVGNNMVLQRDIKLTIWGWADKGEKVTVKISNRMASAKTGTDGKWTLSLETLPAGGPYDMIIKGKNTITLKNILVGDVWICSGQSNMQFPVGAFSYAQQEIDQANYTNIRLFQVPNSVSPKPKDDVPGGEWNPAVKENIREFSAVAYFFGRDLYTKLNVPIGLINTSWGGTIAETWMSAESIKQFPEFKSKMDELYGDNDPFAKAEKSEEERKIKLLQEFNEKDPGIKDSKPSWDHAFFKSSDWLTTQLPQTWERNDLPNYDGTVWYKKEFNLPENVSGKDFILTLGAIDDIDITWVNGVQVGGLNSYNLPREYKIPGNILKPGKNIITVRIIDLGGGGGFSGTSKQMNIQSINDANFTLSLAGDWQYKKGYEAKNIAPSTVNTGPNSYPTLLYNAMLKPLIPFGIKGAIWYQGESNADRAYQYRTLFPALITDWRKKWGLGDFPFLFVQLANFMKTDDQPKSDPWPELREAQTMTLSLPNTGMAVAIDIGDASDIHPANKQEVGKRLALAARKIAYGEDLVYSGPMYESMTVEGNKIRVKFKNIGSGLISKDKYGYLKGFAIAGEDKKFVWAKAVIENNTVLIYSNEVKSPVAVRYAWANNPDDANLYNKDMLPTSPFRTDTWPGVTEGKK